MAIGERIKELRTEAGLSQPQLAVKAGVDQGGLSRIERGLKVNPTLDVLRRLARALDCRVADLLDEENDQRLGLNQHGEKQKAQK
jgi:transcriptional regulator with XRE-family HTH domain